jgi:hypothetical protein
MSPPVGSGAEGQQQRAVQAHGEQQHLTGRDNARGPFPLHQVSGRLRRTYLRASLMRG